jgi:hypothetical protein
LTIQRVRKKAGMLFFRWRKDMSQRLRKTRKSAPRVLFIVGCQRSGTTLMTEILEQDWNAKVFSEHSRLSSQDQVDGLRLNPYPIVRQALNHEPYPLVVLKPLVESQNILVLLDTFLNSCAIWMYRHYKDVVASNLKRFGMGNGIKNLRYIVQGRQDSWRSEHLPGSLRRLVLKHFSEQMNPYDAAALFWYIRNRLYFDLNLGMNPRILTVHYDELVAQPDETMVKVYQHIGCTYPGDQIIRSIHTASVGKGRDIDLSPEIEQLCEELWNAYGKAFTHRPDHQRIALRRS